MNGTGVVVQVFAKAPEPGRVKTRLIPALGAEEAARLHVRLVRHSLAMACEVAPGSVELWASPDAAHPFFADLAAGFPLTLCQQPEGDLGFRLAAAAGSALRRGDWVLLMGSDCPVLDRNHLEGTVRALEYGLDAMVIPAEDGGYVLLGLRRFDPRLFQGIAWSTGRVMAETRRRLAALHWRWRETEPLWDVDRPEDLQRLHRTCPWSCTFA